MRLAGAAGGGAAAVGNSGAEMVVAQCVLLNVEMAWWEWWLTRSVGARGAEATAQGGGWTHGAASEGDAAGGCPAGAGAAAAGGGSG